MNETEPLFPELVEVIPDLLPAPCKYPLFLVAYYPPNERWAIKSPLESNCVTIDSSTGMTAIQREINALLARGWTNIHVFSLPDQGPWSAKK